MKYIYSIEETHFDSLFNITSTKVEFIGHSSLKKACQEISDTIYYYDNVVISNHGTRYMTASYKNRDGIECLRSIKKIAIF